jgi:riboflavin synthase alpha subunit
MLSRICCQEGHLDVARGHWRDLHQAIQKGEVEIDGNNLTLASVVAVSKYVATPLIRFTLGINVTF